ncbi:MAG: carboxypeptidase-like regulatory domain-containing protein [Vicinamibacterales bacterium]
MVRAVFFSVSLLLGLSASAAGQAPQPGAPAPGQPTQGMQQMPPRTPVRPGRPGEAPPKGTAIIRGMVMAADTGTPLRRVQVRALSPETRGGGVTSTGADGRFEIKELPAGRYTVSASKGAFVAIQYGQKRPSEPGTPIELADGQIAEKVNFSLSRGAVIAGRIVDESGEAMSGVNVQAMRYAFIAGSRRLTPAGGMGDRTDDQGAYRVYGLAPGDYYVSATSGFGAGNMVMNLGTTVSNTEADGYAPTYYPGTPNLSEAQRVTLKLGQENANIHFTLNPTRLAQVRGRVLNSRGEAGRGMVMILPGEFNGMLMMGPNTTSMTAPDGSFLLSNVAPGRYNLSIRPMGMPGATDEYAVLPITVASDDLDNVMLTTGVGAIARGVVQTDDGTPPPFRPDDVQLFASTAEPMMMSAGGGPPKINPDYTFEMTSLFDRRLVRGAIQNPTGWYLKGVFVEGEDVTDSGVEFTPGRTYEGLQVVFSQKTTELSGLVTDSRGRPVVDASVVVFPANRERWTYQSRYLRTARPDTEGRYNIKSLPPGEDYLIIAVQNLEQGQGGDPDFLTRAREEAKSLGLNEGEKKAVDVKLSTLVP